MKKNQYIREIVDRTGLSGKYRKKIHQDLTEQYEALKTRGYAREEIMARMGEPDQLAQEIFEGYVETEIPRRPLFEYKSKTTVLGLPLVHIVKAARTSRHGMSVDIGRRTLTHVPTARGIIAIGRRARGVVAIGVLALGLFSIGLLSLGAVSIGMAGLGLVALGNFAGGVLAVGNLSAGALSLGNLSMGWMSAGNLALGRYALGNLARGPIRYSLEDGAIQFDAVDYGAFLDQVPAGLRWFFSPVGGMMDGSLGTSPGPVIAFALGITAVVLIATVVGFVISRRMEPV